jgi:hypothetical protein
MKRDKPIAEKAGIGFDITDTVLTEIDTQLAKLIEADKDDSDDLGLDFGSAFGESEPNER